MSIKTAIAGIVLLFLLTGCIATINFNGGSNIQAHKVMDGKSALELGQQYEAELNQPKKDKK